MNDTELDRMLRTRAVVDDDTVAAWDLQAADVALLESILTEPAASGHPIRPLRRGLLIAAAASMVAVAAVTAAAISGPWPADNAYAADVVAAAEQGPRLLIDDPAWRITYVSESDARNGELHLTDGRSNVQVNWYPAGLLDSYVQDRKMDTGAKSGAGHLFGRPAVTITSHGERGEIQGEILAKLDDSRMVDIWFSDSSAFTVVQADLRIVKATRWLDALPDSVFSGDRRALAIDGMLTGVPLPKGYDSGPLKRRGLVSDRYQLGAMVVQDVGCAWFDRWFDARERNDPAATRVATQVLQASHTWPILKEMTAGGDYPQFFWLYADATKDGLIHGAAVTRLTRDRLPSIGCTG